MINLTAANTAKSGEHKATITAEYEDDEGTQLTSSDTVRIPVRQSVSLEYSGAALPAKLVQGDSSAVSVVFMNTGKSTIYNCIMQFDVEGVSSGGSILIGTIAAGESKSGTANLRPGSGILGEVSGALTISYEDDSAKNTARSLKSHRPSQRKPLPHRRMKRKKTGIPFGGFSCCSGWQSAARRAQAHRLR